MKKISRIFIVLLLVVITALSLTACGDKNFTAQMSNINFDGVSKFVVTGLKEGSVAFVNKVQAKVNDLKNGKFEILVPEEFLKDDEDIELEVGDDKDNLTKMQYVNLGKPQVVIKDGVADWSQSADAFAEFAPVSYIVYDNGKEIAVSEMSYAIPADGVAHEIKVRAVKTGLYYGVYSDSVNSTVLNAPFQISAAITSEEFDVKKAPVTFRWEAVNNCKKYNVVINDGEPVQTETNELSVVVDMSTGLKVKVQAVSDSDQYLSSPYSAEQTYNFFRQINSSDITVKDGTISWPASDEAGVAGYMIEINGKKLEQVLDKPEYTGLERGSDYMVRIRTVSSQEGHSFSRWSDPIKVNILNSVQNPKFVVNNDSYTLLWDSVNTAYRYNVVMKYYATTDSSAEPEVTEYEVSGTSLSSYREKETFSFSKPGKYTLEVCALGNPLTGVYSSSYSTPITVIRLSSPEEVSFNDYQDFETNTRNITVSVTKKGMWAAEVYKLQMNNIEISSASDENNAVTFELPLMLDKESKVYSIEISPKVVQSQSSDRNVMYLNSLDTFKMTFVKLGAPTDLRVVNNTTKDNVGNGEYICQFKSLGDTFEIEGGAKYDLSGVKYYSYCNGLMIGEKDKDDPTKINAMLPGAYEIGAANAYAMAVPENVEIKEADKKFEYGNTLSKSDAKNNPVFIASERSNAVDLLKLGKIDENTVTLTYNVDSYTLDFGAVDNAKGYYITYQTPETDGKVPMGAGRSLTGNNVPGYYDTPDDITVPFDVVNYGYARLSITVLGNVPTPEDEYDANALYYVNSVETNYEAFKLKPIDRKDIIVSSDLITWNYEAGDAVSGYDIYMITPNYEDGGYKSNHIASTSGKEFNIDKFTLPKEYTIAIAPIVSENAKGWFAHEMDGAILNEGVRYENITDNPTDNAVEGVVKVAFVDFSILKNPELRIGSDLGDVEGVNPGAIYWEKQEGARKYDIIAGGKDITYNNKEVVVGDVTYLEYVPAFDKVQNTEIVVTAIGRDQFINEQTGEITNAIVNSDPVSVRVEVKMLANPELKKLNVNESADKKSIEMTPENANSLNGYLFKVGTNVFEGDKLVLNKENLAADYKIQYAVKGDVFTKKYSDVNDQFVYYLSSGYSNEINIGVLGNVTKVNFSSVISEGSKIVSAKWNHINNYTYALYLVEYKLIDKDLNVYVTGSAVTADNNYNMTFAPEYLGKNYQLKVTVTPLSNSIYYISRGMAQSGVFNI